jgi:hypothetical protein
MRLFIFQLVALGVALPALAGITYTCDASFGNPANNAPAGACAAINGSSVAGIYSGILGNANARIFIQFGATGVGSSEFNLLSVPYSAYYGALSTLSTSSAVQSLTSVDPITGFGNTDTTVDVTAALGSALGLAGASLAGIIADASSPTGFSSCDLSGPGPCYNGYITMAAGASFFYYPTSSADNGNGSQVDFYNVVQHETDEILGTVSCIGTNGANAAFDQCGHSDAAPADLFRFASQNTPSFLTTANGSLAYFSTDRGATNLSTYINTPGVGDFGDWVFNGTVKVQDGEVSPGYADLITDGGSEISVLNAVGFNLVPEPGTWGLVGASLVAIALFLKK